MQFIAFLLLGLPAVFGMPLPQRGNACQPQNTGGDGVGSGLLGNGVNVELLSFDPDFGSLFGSDGGEGNCRYLLNKLADDVATDC